MVDVRIVRSRASANAGCAGDGTLQLRQGFANVLNALVFYASTQGIGCR